MTQKILKHSHLHLKGCVRKHSNKVRESRIKEDRIAGCRSNMSDVQHQQQRVNLQRKANAIVEFHEKNWIIKKLLLACETTCVILEAAAPHFCCFYVSEGSFVLFHSNFYACGYDTNKDSYKVVAISSVEANFFSIKHFWWSVDEHKKARWVVAVTEEQS